MAALCAALLIPLCAKAWTASVAFAPSEAEIVNPFIGSAAWAEDDGEREQPFTLVYANLRWADLESEPGVYDFSTFEEEHHFEKWRAEGKKLILRFVMDVPGDKKHLDIPRWLYDLTGDGEYYRVSYGRGYCPNYENPELIEAHARAIAALGERYGEDPFVAYVQLGSLGHWGEWHVHDDAGRMPAEAVRDRYAAPYLRAFPEALLMMRRPFRFAKTHGLGLFNDTAGEPESTARWLRWIEEGGAYDQTEETDALMPMQAAWKNAPVGGELATSMEKEEMLSDAFAQTLALFAASHTSWIGPGSFVEVERGGALQAALDELNRVLGYRLRIARAQIECDGRDASLTIDWTNDGNAPFYFDWRAAIRLVNKDGDARTIETDLCLRDILPGEMLRTQLDIGEVTEECRIETAILDPQTGEPGVRLAMDAPQDGLWYHLMTVAP